MTPAFDRARPIAHADGPFVALPLGGIGTGNVALAADGGLRQWQLHNIGNHLGDLPDTFFALRVSCLEPPLDVTRVLQAPPVAHEPTPLVNDDAVPAWQRRLTAAHGVEATTLRAVYPEAWVDYHDAAWPVEMRLHATTPMAPLNVADSSLPVAMFTFEITNRGPHPVHGWLGGSVQNAIGWDGVTPIDGVDCPTYGGNVNRIRRRAGWTQAICENPSLPADDPRAGQLVLATDDDRASAYPQYASPEQFLAFLAGRSWGERRVHVSRASSWPDGQPHAPTSVSGPSAPGRTWDAGLAHRFDLASGETATIRYLLAWYLPNRTVNFLQFGPTDPRWGASRFWLGNHYATLASDAQDVADRVIPRWEELRATTSAWTSALAASDLDEIELEHFAAQAAYVRSPTCFVSAEGEFFGFEGVLGASTTMWNGDVGGSCPLNCTHVWNYEQALAALWPSLERSMRRTEFEVAQAPEGYLPHRVLVPTYLPQLWEVKIGGPEEPALDGMLGAVLKTYREYLRGAGEEWLRGYWPSLLRLLDHVHGRWDPEETGLLHGIQPSTHDIDLCGINPFMGTLWLAALRAGEEMACALGDDERRAEFAARFTRASRAYDEALFTGEQYVQVLEDGDRREFQWESGCLSDQLIGQWWAHQLGLGYLLPADHVRTALAAVVRHNFRADFTGFEHGYRVYADGAEGGLLMCSWPDGGRPAVPTRYCDEVWTGIEYQVAAHCRFEGLDAEADRLLGALWARYDGRRRNPYNEIECGDHYARAMAGWSALEARGGYRIDAARHVVHDRGGAPGRWPIVLADGYGHLVRDAEGVTLSGAGLEAWRVEG